MRGMPLQRLDPHVPEGDGIAVILQQKGSHCHFLFPDAAGSGAPQLNIVLDAHAVLEDGDSCVLGHISVGIESGCAQENVVGLPLKGGLAGIGERCKGAFALSMRGEKCKFCKDCP